MAWHWIQQEFPSQLMFHKQLLWTNKNCNIYFAVKKNIGDAWNWYAGNVSHELESGLLLTPRATESVAQTNYLTTDRDSNGKFVALFPFVVQAKYVRLYVETGNNVQIYEWKSSSYFRMDEIVSGELLITDKLSDAPIIRVSSSDIDRIKIGNYEGSTYGIVGFDASSEKIFELSDSNNMIAGWTFDKDKIYNDGILIDSTNKRIRSGNYVSGTFGAGFTLEPDLLEVGNIAARGMIRTAVFQKDVISAVGGSVIVSKGADTLAEDMTASDVSTLVTKGEETFAVGDILRIKEGVDDEWFEVTNASIPEYVVTRDKAGVYGADANPEWKKGAAVVNFGQSGDGGIYLTASESNAPYMSVITHTGEPWDTITTRLRIGNLNGYAGYVSDTYGMAVYEDENNYLKADIDGIQISSDKDGALTIAGGGNVKLLSGGDFHLETDEVTPSKIVWFTAGVEQFALTTVGAGILGWGAKEDGYGSLLFGYPYQMGLMEFNAEQVLLKSEYAAGGSAGSETAPTSTCTDPNDDTNVTTGWTPGYSAALSSVLKTSTYYPPAHNTTYVKATTNHYDTHRCWFATDPSLSLTGASTYNSWQVYPYPSPTEQRFHIDLGSAKVVNKIYYENHHSSGGDTNRGVRNFTFWGSNTVGAFAELTYGVDTNWTQLTTSQSSFDQHAASNAPDPKFITVTNTTAYRYYAFKFADNWGNSDLIGIRHVELQFAESATYSLQIARDGVSNPYASASLGIHSDTGLKYDFSFKVRARNCPKASYRAYIYFGSSEVYLPTSATQTVTGAWVSHSYSLIIPAGAGSSGLFLRNMTTLNTEYVEFDDVTVTRTSGMPSAEVIVESGNAVGRVRIKTFEADNLVVDAGNVTMPLQPAFQANLTANQDNIATNTNVTITFNNEIFDKGENFNPATYTFTAPVTGSYLLNAVIRLDSIDTAATYYQVLIVTSNRNYTTSLDPSKFSADVGYLPFTISVVADMDANDTVYIRVYQSGGTSQTDVHNNSYFSGALLC